MHVTWAEKIWRIRIPAAVDYLVGYLQPLFQGIHYDIMIAIYPRAEELTCDGLVLEVHGLTAHRPGGLLLKAKLPLLLQLLLVV
jgi:hypothetical protein